MRWYLSRHRDNRAKGNDDATAPGLTGLPTALLQRHGARVLDPAAAATLSGQRAPRPTIYRTRTLLVPDELITHSVITGALSGIGLKLVKPTGGGQPTGKTGHLADRLRRLPKPAVLVAEPGEHDKPANPVVVDAWTALQAIRAAAAAQGEGPTLDVRRISLEHLLVGSAITGSPASDGGGVTGSPASDGGGVTGPGSADSYMLGGGDARLPVELCLDAPARERAEMVTARWGRRPVVAVLDTGLRAHPWLGVLRRADGSYHIDPGACVAIDAAIQGVIGANAAALASDGDQPRRLIEDPWDQPVTADPLVGELDTHTGHGTFIAGIVRQATPDATVLAIRIMHSDGIVYEGDLMCALAEIASRVDAALSGHMSKMVDVVSLSLGYFSETTPDEVYSTGLREVIDILLGLGVTVTAAAGNYSTSRRFYPAGFAGPGAVPGSVPVPGGGSATGGSATSGSATGGSATGGDDPGGGTLISVGALNPNGSKALFSDGGSWVTAWAEGAAVISTFPTDVNGSRDPAVCVPGHPDNAPPTDSFSRKRESLDPDDFTSGFAVWSGTSFSAPLVAAVLAGKLLAGAEAGLRLDEPGRSAAINRAKQAMKDLENPGWQD